MVLKVYGASESPATRCVMLMCKELNIPYELIAVDLMKGEQKTPEFRKKHPFGQVPVIDDDGFMLYESRAICRYLAAKAGSPLLPQQSDLQSWAKFETACSVEFANFHPPTNGLVWEKIVKVQCLGLPENEAAAEQFMNTLEGHLDVYEDILSKQKYLAGNEITLADLFHVPNGDYIEKALGVNFNSSSRPNVARWWKDTSSRPSWKSITDNSA